MLARFCNRTLHLASLAAILVLCRLVASAPVTIARSPLQLPEPRVVCPALHCPPAPAEPPNCESNDRDLEGRARAAAEARWRDRAERLERQLAESDRLRAAQAADLERYRTGLLGQPPVLRGRRAVGSGRSIASKLSVTGAKVQLIGSDAFVTGVLRNGGDRDANVELIVELLLDQQVHDQARLRLLAPARSSTPFSHTFLTGLSDGTYAARARVSR